MRRFYWLLALPYAVVQLKCQPQPNQICFSDYFYQVQDSNMKEVQRFQEKDMADDLAAALNYAHERRIANQAPEDIDPVDPIKWRDVPVQDGK